MHPSTQGLLEVRDQRGLVRVGLVQHDLLVPLELKALGGNAEFSTRAGAIGYLRSQLPLPATQD